jgi:hypothetical protein
MSARFPALDWLGLGETFAMEKALARMPKFTIGLADRDEPTLGDSQEACAAATAHLRHNSSTVSTRYPL